MGNLSERVRSEVRTIKREVIFVDVAVILLGLVMILYPGASRNIICRAAGILLCVFGAARVAAYFVSDRTEAFSSFALVQGTALIGFGVYFLIRPEFLAAFLTVALAIILIVGGVMKLQYAIDFLRLHASVWWIQLIGALLTAGLGVVALVNPFKAADTLIIFLGIAFLIDGVWDLISVTRLSSRAKQVKKTVRQVLRDEGAADTTGTRVDQ